VKVLPVVATNEAGVADEKRRLAHMHLSYIALILLDPQYLIPPKPSLASSLDTLLVFVKRFSSSSRTHPLPFVSSSHNLTHP
jgi:hypothetical protein